MEPAASTLIQRRAQTLGPAYRLFYDRPVHVARAEGVWIQDTEGNNYLDVYNNVASLGHCHPRVVAALARQAGTLNTHTRYIEDTVLEYVERLLAHFPAALSNAMLTCTGSEANDLAMRIARAATGGTGIIVTRLAYHGVTSAVAEISPSFGDGVPLGQHVRAVPAPDGYRGGPDVGRRFAEGVREAIADMKRHGVKPAALIVDTIFSSDGVFSDPPGFLQEAVQAIRDAGGVFIADEVQAGFGRTGTHMWGFERHQLVPDIVSLGKPMGNGYPVAGVVAKPALINAFADSSRYFNTFGGNPVASAVGLAVLDVIRDEGLLENVTEVGRYLRTGLDDMAQRSALIGDIRGAGFFIGVDLVRDRESKTPLTAGAEQLVNLMRKKRILISATGPGGNVLKLRPQLVFRREHADVFLSVLESSLQEIENSET